MVQKGKISSVEATPIDANGNPTTARIIPSTGDGIVTRPLIIPWRLRGKSGELKSGVDVVYVVFEDYTGIILDRADGEFFGHAYGDIHVHGDIATDKVPSYNGHRHPYNWTDPGGASDTQPPK